MEITEKQVLKLGIYSTTAIPDEFKSLLFREDVVACEVTDCQMFMKQQVMGSDLSGFPTPTDDSTYRGQQNGPAFIL